MTSQALCPDAAGYSVRMPTATFTDLSVRFAGQFDRVRDCTRLEYVRADWDRRNTELAADLLPFPPPDFLLHPVIAFQMFVNERVVPHELPFVRRWFGDDALLADDAVGGIPTTRLDCGVVTSSNTVHQLHHLARYEQATGRDLREVRTVVEWGGGFGSLIRLLVRRHGDRPTCVVVDTPVFSAVQWLYLASVLGEDAVVLHDRAPVRPERGRINLVPIGLANEIDVAADLFISNWALNESTPAAQRDVLDSRWYGAGGVLLAMHAGDPLTAAAVEQGARPVPLGEFMPGQQYLVS